MFQKDFLLRQITVFFDALNQIINSIDKNDIGSARVQISDTYLLLGNNANYFLTTPINSLLEYFKEKSNDYYLEKIKMLFQIMYYDAIVNKSILEGKQVLKKSILLLEYYLENTTEYSFELHNQLIEMKNRFDNINM